MRLSIAKTYINYYRDYGVSLLWLRGWVRSTKRCLVLGVDLLRHEAGRDHKFFDRALMLL